MVSFLPPQDYKLHLSVFGVNSGNGFFLTPNILWDPGARSMKNRAIFMEGRQAYFVAFELEWNRDTQALTGANLRAFVFDSKACLSTLISQSFSPLFPHCRRTTP